MKPHEQRVIDEKAELDARLANLIPFLSSDTCHALSFDERNRRCTQAMTDLYNNDRGLTRGEWKTLQL